jgi:hypothetical protein
VELYSNPRCPPKSHEQSQCLVNAVTVHVGTGTNMSGFPMADSEIIHSARLTRLAKNFLIPLVKSRTISERAVLFVKKYAGLIVAFAIAAAVIIAWLTASKISGEVSAVIGDASPVGVPDAHCHTLQSARGTAPATTRVD